MRMLISFFRVHLHGFFLLTMHREEQMDADDTITIEDVTSNHVELHAPMLSLWAAQLALPRDASVTDAALEDASVRTWMDANALLSGGSTFAWQIFSHPTANVDLLKARQQAIKALPTSLKRHLLQLRGTEMDVLWLFSLPTLEEAPSLQLLFPHTPFIRFINYSSTALSLFHVYRGYLAPIMPFLGPCTTVAGPYLYMRRNLGMPITVATYVRMLVTMARVIGKPSGNVKQDLVKLGSVVLYGIMFVLGVMQSVQLAKTVRTLRRGVMKRLDALRSFVATTAAVQQTVPIGVWQAFGIAPPGRPIVIPPGIRGMHVLLTNGSIRAELEATLKRMYVLDAACMMRKPGMCFAKYATDTHPFILNMGHLALGRNQVRNPMCLRKNLIITGPNAGGKTTYVRAICANVLLAQTFGVAVAKAAVMTPYHNFSSFMRIADTLGNASLFEAEARRCADIIDMVERAASRGERSIVFLDEPMHSTPPIEGASTSMSVIEHIGRLPGTRAIATTHYFSITELASQRSAHFQNVSMEAIPMANGFSFPYKIRNGPSFQCIALELLQDSNLPERVITRAMEWKNKLCAREVRINDR